MTKIRILFCAAIVLTLAVTGCARPPAEEMNNAYEMVTRAENDFDAVTYGGPSLARARDALARMQAAADSKRYDSAKSYAAEAVASAVRAIDEGRAGVIRARDDASALVSELRPLVTETEQAISAAKAAGLALNFDDIDEEFETACLNYDLAQASLSAGYFQESLELGRSARAGFNGINRQLSDAAMEATRQK